MIPRSMVCLRKISGDNLHKGDNEDDDDDDDNNNNNNNNNIGTMASMQELAIYSP
jgi:hypothetical protein